VLTSAGAVEVTAPRVNDKRVDPDTGERKRFASAILPAWFYPGHGDDSILGEQKPHIDEWRSRGW
jgi:hypothetical protein